MDIVLKTFVGLFQRYCLLQDSGKSVNKTHAVNITRIVKFCSSTLGGFVPSSRFVFFNCHSLWDYILKVTYLLMSELLL